MTPETQQLLSDVALLENGASNQIELSVQATRGYHMQVQQAAERIRTALTPKVEEAAKQGTSNG